MPGARRFRNFSAFYPFYLSEHSNRASRRLHFLGTSIAVLCLLLAVATRSPWWILAGFLQGYAFAWVGHFFLEKNRPATFTYPLYSFMGDWVMWKEMLTGKIRF